MDSCGARHSNLIVSDVSDVQAIVAGCIACFVYIRDAPYKINYKIELSQVWCLIVSNPDLGLLSFIFSIWFIP